MSFSIYQKGLSLYLLLLIVFWVSLYHSGFKTDFWNYFYSFSFSLIPLIGGGVGVVISKRWGFLGSVIGRAIFYISSGLFSWGVGSMIWSYYNFFLQVSAPYPSLADVGFIVALPLWVLGVFNLSKATGAKFALKNIKGRLFLIAVPIVVLIASYYLLVVIARGGILTEAGNDFLKLFFDLAYPTGDVVILTLAILIFGLSFKYFGGLYKTSIYSLLFGFALMYLADFVFSYTTTVDTFYNGNYGDMLFTLALFFITFGILGFSKTIKT